MAKHYTKNASFWSTEKCKGLNWSIFTVHCFHNSIENHKNFSNHLPHQGSKKRMINWLLFKLFYVRGWRIIPYPQTAPWLSININVYYPQGYLRSGLLFGVFLWASSLRSTQNESPGGLVWWKRTQKSSDVTRDRDLPAEKKLCVIITKPSGREWHTATTSAVVAASENQNWIMTFVHKRREGWFRYAWTVKYTWAMRESHLHSSRHCDNIRITD